MARDDSWGITLSTTLQRGPSWTSESLSVLQSFCDCFEAPECEFFAITQSELNDYLCETKRLLEKEEIEEHEFKDLTSFVAGNPSAQYWVYAWW